MSAGERTDEPWYSDGLDFGCTRCGRCCTGEGVVHVSDAEIARLAERLDLDELAFRGIYTRELRGGVVALRDRGNRARDCVFYEARGGGCQVYADRPKQCRTWPFWRPNLHSPERWAEEAALCPGMNRGRHHDRQEIEALAADDGLAPRRSEP